MWGGSIESHCGDDDEKCDGEFVDAMHRINGVLMFVRLVFPFSIEALRYSPILILIIISYIKSYNMVYIISE